MSKIVLSTLILACLVAAGLAAQTQEKEQSDIEVVVTASRVEEPAEEAPAHVTVITAEELSASGQTTLVDALDGLAGIHFRSSSGNSAQAEISMRGFGENSFGRVLVLLDGRRLNRPDMASINWLEIPIENIERVEVVRGGSSVLYGDNAVAGVINIITKKGSEGFSFDVSGMYGSYNQNQEGAGVSGSIGALRLSANAEHSATDGYRDRSAYRSLGGGVTLGLDLERFAGSLALSYSRLYYEIPGYLTEVEVAADPTTSINPADESNNQYLNADLDFSYGLGDRGVLDANLSYGFKSIASDMASRGSYSDLSLHTLVLTPKVQVDADILAGNRLVLGVDGAVDLLNLKTYLNTDRVSLTLENQILKSSAGAYLMDDLNLLPSLMVRGGLRYDLSWLFAETLVSSGSSIDATKLFQRLVYDLGLFVTPFPWARLWMRHGTVFRYPALDEIADLYDSGYLSSPFNTNLQPETGWTVELGGQARILRVFDLSVSAYWLEMQNEITFDGVAGLNVNLDSTRHLGVEADAALHIPRWLDLTGTYTFTLATLETGVDAGNLIPLVPVHQATFGATVRLPLGFFVQGQERYVGPVYAGMDFDNNQTQLEGYWLLDLSLRYAPDYLPGKLELFFGVTNLLDVVYSTTGFDWGALVVYYPGQGRSWKVGASYRY